VCRCVDRPSRIIDTPFFCANYPDFYILFFIILFFPETEFQVIKIKGAAPYDAAPSVLRIERVRAEVVDASDK
jgi:hypothetical protein